MSQIQRTVNHCDVCGHEWLPQVGVAYSHCTSGKCRSRKWDRGEAEKVKAPVSKTGHAGSTPASPAKTTMKKLRTIAAGVGHAMMNPPSRDPVEDFHAAPPEPQPLCVSCLGLMREVKGKWACSDVSCGLYGREQHIRKQHPGQAIR